MYDICHGVAKLKKADKRMDVNNYKRPMAVKSKIAS